jgi:glycosyltransferase involved in cell wall biosynthesis
VEIINVAIDGGTLPTARRLLRELDGRKPQVVHIVKPRAHAGLVQWWLTQRPRPYRPRVVLDVDDWEQAWAPINRYPWPLARFLAWQEEWGIRHASAITAASRWLEQRAHAYAPRASVLYLPNGIASPSADAEVEGTASPLSPQPTRPDGAVLFFTRFVEVTPAWLAQFCSSLYAIRPQVRLIVAGTPVQAGLDAPFRQQVAASPAAPAVEWLGFVPPADVPALYARVSCAIFPAANVPLQMAKCSVRLATTLLQGVPVVASAVGEQAAYGAGGAARLVGAEASPAEFAAAVDDVLRHPQLQADMAAAARARLLARYDWGGLAGELDQFYRRLLERTSGAQ